MDDCTGDVLILDILEPTTATFDTREHVHSVCLSLVINWKKKEKTRKGARFFPFTRLIKVIHPPQSATLFKCLEWMVILTGNGIHFVLMMIVCSECSARTVEVLVPEGVIIANQNRTWTSSGRDNIWVMPTWFTDIQVTQGDGQSRQVVCITSQFVSANLILDALVRSIWNDSGRVWYSPHDRSWPDV